MKILKNIRPYLFSAPLGIALGWAAVLIINSEDDVTSQNSENKSPTRLLAKTNSRSNPKQSQANKALNLAKKGDPKYVAEFLQNWLELHVDDQNYIISQLSSSIFEDPDKHYDFIRDFATELYKVDRSLAISTISRLPREERIRNVERHLLNDFISTDPEVLLGSFTKHASDNSSINTSQLYQIAAIYSNENVEQFDDYVTWLSNLDTSDKNLNNLQRAAYEALSVHSPTEHREELFNNMMSRSLSDPLFRSFPAILVGKHAAENPEQAATWLDEMPPGPWKDQALYRFLSTAGEFQAQAGADLMNRESFLAEFAVTWDTGEDGTVRASATQPSKKEAEEYYDTSLEHFLTNALRNDPSLVFDSADAFYDSQLKEDFKAAAQLAMGGGKPPLIKASHLPACADGCQQNHH